VKAVEQFLHFGGPVLMI